MLPEHVNTHETKVQLLFREHHYNAHQPVDWMIKTPASQGKKAIITSRPIVNGLKNYANHFSFFKSKQIRRKS
jgi:hypothetical protein